MEIINNVQSNTTTSDLILKFPIRNSATTVIAERGELITGTLGVSSISAITPKPNNSNLFASGYAKLPGNSINRQDRIDATLDPSKKFKEDYSIEWKDNLNNAHTYGPLIQVTPGP